MLADMWEAAKALRYDHPAFDQDLYHQFRSRGLSMDDFLGRQLQTLHVNQTDAVDFGLILDLLAYHTTPLGTAEQRSMMALEQTYSHRKDVLSEVVQECHDLYLLVDPLQNLSGQSRASRLNRDTLAPHVRKRFDESDAPGQRARRILESRVVDWKMGKVGQPLDQADFRTVVIGVNGCRTLSSEEKDLLLVRIKVAQRQRRNRLLLLGALALLFFVLVAITIQTTVYPGLLKVIARQAGSSVFVAYLDQWVEAYEVTNQRYHWCHDAGTCTEPARQLGNYYAHGAERYPVTGVNVWQAAEFCRWVGRRLPYLDEGQRLATNGEASPWPWGIHPHDTDLANLCYGNCEDDPGGPDEVGSHPAGAIEGVSDIIGNVAEWTATNFDEYWQQGEDWSGEDPAAMSEQVAIVGGSYYSTPNEQMVSSRMSSSPADGVGFRCVRQ